MKPFLCGIEALVAHGGPYEPLDGTDRNAAGPGAYIIASGEKSWKQRGSQQPRANQQLVSCQVAENSCQSEILRNVFQEIINDNNKYGIHLR